VLQYAAISAIAEPLSLQRYHYYAGASMKSKVGISGDSGGGTITSSVAHDVPVDFEVRKLNEVACSVYGRCKGKAVVNPFSTWHWHVA